MQVLINGQPYELKPTDVITLSPDEFVKQATESDKLKQDLEDAYLSIKQLNQQLSQLQDALSKSEHDLKVATNYVSMLIEEKLPEPKFIHTQVQELSAQRSLIRAKDVQIANLTRQLEEVRALMERNPNIDQLINKFKES